LYPFAKPKHQTIMMLRTIIAMVIGGALGYVYYRLVGCSTGACPITSNPWISTFYGAFIGLLFAGGK
jgi:hypothetical protein